MIKTFAQMQGIVLEKAKKFGKKRAVLVACEDIEGLVAMQEADAEGLVTPVLIGDIEKTKKICAEIGYDISGVELINEPNPIAAGKRGVAMCKAGEGDMLLKGQIKTADFLRPVVNKETGIKKNAILSAVSVAEIDLLDRLVVITDTGMLIKPSLKEKAAMIENAAECSAKINGRKPKCAVLCAVEVVNEAMPDTIDAALLAKMSDRGQIKGAIVDGPFALDNAVSKKAAEMKHIKSDVAGDADILLLPDIEAGNIFMKAVTYMAKYINGSYIHGATVPVLASSRSNSRREKFNSMILALFMTDDK